MCHLLLAMPAIGLVSFFLLPLGPALAIYLAISFLSLGLYYLVIKAARRPVQTGLESLLGSAGEVVSRLDPAAAGQYLVRCQGELWTALSREMLDPGDRVKIVALEGMKPVVQRAETEQGT